MAVLLMHAARGFAGPADRFALILNDPAAGARTATAQRSKLIEAQEKVRSALADRKIPVMGSAQTLLNAIFVSASPDRVGELRALPGVAGVVPMARMTRKLNQAINLVNAPAGWAAVGGTSGAGAGMKIAVIDTGIDETHPGFQDPSLSMPAGFPKTGNANDATHATTKIIAVRSFVAQLAIPSDNPAATLPDDLSSRDRVGHGTAVAMIAAGVSHSSPLGTISGVAPKAWLGNYKIFGSPGVNDTTTADVVLQALEAAFNDGMDVAVLSVGGVSAQWAATDQGSVCKAPAGTFCDPWITAITAATNGGMIVVVPAGNDGELGLSTINSPGDLRGAITVGATSNAHVVASTLTTPAGTEGLARMGDGPQLLGAISLPLFAVASVDSTEHGCLPYPEGFLQGAIALISLGQCSYATKVMNAQAAGATAVLLFNTPGGALFSPTGLSNTGIPAGLITADVGTALKKYLSLQPGGVVTLNPVTAETLSSAPEQVAYFSSRGPNIGDAAIKPDLVAPGSSIYTAAQNYDPNGALYSANRYIGVDGTSFAAAFVAGTAALVKQAHPAYTASQVASAVVNSATSSITDLDANGNSVPARVTAMGSGRLNVQAAIASTVTVAPPSVSFGAVNTGLVSQNLTITNTGAAAATLQFSLQQRDPDANASVGLSVPSLNLAPGQSGTLTVALTGTIPSPGSYEGAISVMGGAVPLRIPYLYISGSSSPSGIMPVLGQNFVTEAGSVVDLSFRVLDPYGASVSSVQVRFAPADAVYAATSSTDNLGIAEAYMRTPAQTGDQLFEADLMGNAGRVEFAGRTRGMPDLTLEGVVDAASLQAPAGFAPGSYVTLFGTALSESFEVVRTSYLPLSLAGVSVSFDVPGTKIHVPGRFYFVSNSQISVQIPWELAGNSSAVMKVTLNNSQSKTVRPENIDLSTNQSQLVTIPLAAYSPAFFEYSEAAGGKLLAAALDENDALIGSANPVQRGHAVQFYLNGLGAVTPGAQPASGEAAPGTPPFATTLATPTVMIGGQQAAVFFSGLAPLTVGLYQVNAVVPVGISPGLAPVVISIGGVSSKATTLAVQ